MKKYRGLASALNGISIKAIENERNPKTAFGSTFINSAGVYERRKVIYRPQARPKAHRGERAE